MVNQKSTQKEGTKKRAESGKSGLKGEGGGVRGQIRAWHQNSLFQGWRKGTYSKTTEKKGREGKNKKV